MSKKIEHEGIIVALDANTVYVRIEQGSACSECHANKACGVARSKEKIIEIPRTPGNYLKGEKVCITGKTSIGLMAVFYAFVIPLLLIIISLGVSTHLEWNEGIAGLVSILVFIIYYLALYFFRRKLKQKFVFSIK